MRESLSVVSAECRGAKTLAITFMPVPFVVVRFPVELRAEPSMDLIREIEPDAREVVLVAECFGLEPPMVDLCDRVDAETARFIAEQVLPLSREERGRALRELLHPVVVAAVEACGVADGMSKRSAAAAAGDLLHAQASGGYWMAALEERSNARMMDAAALLIVAHCRCQEAHGVSRAVGMARRGEAWEPYRASEASVWLARAGRVVGGS
jgi:hypothetical protein